MFRHASVSSSEKQQLAIKHKSPLKDKNIQKVSEHVSTSLQLNNKTTTTTHRYEILLHYTKRNLKLANQTTNLTRLSFNSRPLSLHYMQTDKSGKKFSE